MRTARVPLLLGVLFIAACASSGTTSSAPSSRSAITAEEIASIQVRTAYEAVERLRPTWLRARGMSNVTSGGQDYAAIFVNGNRYGELPTLRDIQASDVVSIFYLEPADATTRYGTGYSGGIIDVRTR